jgi:hypothetical protein
MIDVENYYKGFKPVFNQERYNELMSKTPTSFKTYAGNIYGSKILVKSILTSCRLLWHEFDRNNIYYGGEGGGKSHTVFQHTYIWWWCLNELGMINYDYGMHLIYGKVKHLMEAFDTYKDIPFVIYSLDESDELNRKNWNKPVVKEFMSKLRKERKNLRIVNLIMPALEEMLPAITLSRIAWIIEIDVHLDKNLNVVRGAFALMNIPISNTYTSPMWKNTISRREIKAYLGGRLYSNEDKFSSLPKKFLAFTDRTNKIFMFDKNEYRDWARNINAEVEEEEQTDLQKRQTAQRNRLVVYLKEEMGLTQAKIATIAGLGKTAIGEICSSASSLIKAT